MKKLGMYLAVFFFFGAWGIYLFRTAERKAESGGSTPNATLTLTYEGKAASPGSLLVLHAQIKNNGPDDFTMVTCSCSIWDSWSVEGDMVEIPQGGCRANVCAPEIFPSHGEIEKTIEVIIAKNALPGAVTFHLRFGEPASEHGSIRRTILSNPITVEIRKP